MTFYLFIMTSQQSEDSKRWRTKLQEILYCDLITFLLYIYDKIFNIYDIIPINYYVTIKYLWRHNSLRIARDEAARYKRQLTLIGDYEREIDRLRTEVDILTTEKVIEQDR